MTDPFPAPGPSTVAAAIAQVESVVLGKPHQIRLAVACLLAHGHLLIEDLPGVGKTTLAKALGRATGLTARRIQFTSDLLPADILGGPVFDPATRAFTFHPGPIFAGVVLADEINRASPRTQSALLEAMEEHAVSCDGQRHLLPAPFFVIATQNPQEQAGTFPLPDSQLDRFLMRLSLGPPGRDAERELLAGGDRQRVTDALTPVLSAASLVAVQDRVARVHVAAPVREYLLDLVAASRVGSARGLSPRAGLGLQRAAQAWALIAGRDAVHPEDIAAVGEAVIAHRLGSRERAQALLGVVAVR